jgi:hypothetical protein
MYIISITCAAFVSCGLASAWVSKTDRPSVELCRGEGELILKFAGQDARNFRIDCEPADKPASAAKK